MLRACVAAVLCCVLSAGSAEASGGFVAVEGGAVAVPLVVVPVVPLATAVPVVFEARVAQVRPSVRVCGRSVARLRVVRTLCR